MGNLNTLSTWFKKQRWRQLKKSPLMNVSWFWGFLGLENYFWRFVKRFTKLSKPLAQIHHQIGSRVGLERWTRANIPRAQGLVVFYAHLKMTNLSMTIFNYLPIEVCLGLESYWFKWKIKPNNLWWPMQVIPTMKWKLRIILMKGNI
jgi:hypothetical protein